jgi:hypothetical protein
MEHRRLRGRHRGCAKTLLVATGLLLAGCASPARWPMLGPTGTLDRDIVAPWPELAIDLHSDPGEGPVLVEVTYPVSAEQVAAFHRPALLQPAADPCPAQLRG